LLAFGERNTSKGVAESSLQQTAGKAYHSDVSSVKLPVLVHIIQPATVLLVQLLQFYNTPYGTDTHVLL
jgi:hypothetical protein